MGNATSIQALTRLNQLVLEKNDAEKAIKEAHKKLKVLEEVNKKTVEQVNLHRFKTDVLINMLTIEEGKHAVSLKRVEALKFALANNNDLTDEAKASVLTNLIYTERDADDDKTESISLLFDIPGVLSKLNSELNENKGKDKNPNANYSKICQWFTTKEGDLRTIMDRDEFASIICKNCKSLNHRDAEVT